MIHRKITYTPGMQAAYLRSLNKYSSAGYVNPNLAADQTLGNFARQENQRLNALDRAGEERDRILKYHNEDMKYNNDILKMQKAELNSRKAGFNVATLLGLGKLGLGYANAKATDKFRNETMADTKNKLSMQLNYIKSTNPRQYKWLLSQPYVQAQIKRFGISLDNLNTNNVVEGF